MSNMCVQYGALMNCVRPADLSFRATTVCTVKSCGRQIGRSQQLEQCLDLQLCSEQSGFQALLQSGRSPLHFDVPLSTALVKIGGRNGC
jgi:hypothetical protein